MKELVIIGAGNFGRETVWLAESINKIQPTYNVLGFLDDTEEKQGKEFCGYPCLGKIPFLKELAQQRSIYAVIAMESCAGRQKIVASLGEFTNWETLIHPSANIAESARIGAGSIICANTSISVSTSIGNHCLINIGTIIGHDTAIGNYVSIMPGVCICGNAVINDSVYLGVNCSVMPKITIGAKAKVGAGSAVLKDVSASTTVLGVPAAPIQISAPQPSLKQQKGWQDFLNFAAAIFQTDPRELKADTAYGDYEKWDSLMHMTLVMSIEEKYGITIPIEEIPQLKTLQDLYRRTRTNLE